MKPPRSLLYSRRRREEASSGFFTTRGPLTSGVSHVCCAMILNAGWMSPRHLIAGILAIETMSERTDHPERVEMAASPQPERKSGSPMDVDQRTASSDAPERREASPEEPQEPEKSESSEEPEDPNLQYEDEEGNAVQVKSLLPMHHVPAL